MWNPAPFPTIPIFLLPRLSISLFKYGGPLYSSFWYLNTETNKKIHVTKIIWFLLEILNYTYTYYKYFPHITQSVIPYNIFIWKVYILYIFY